MANVPKALPSYRFDNFFHPFVGDLIAKLNREGVSGILDPAWQEELTVQWERWTEAYSPSKDVQMQFFPRKIDFSSDGAYATYNWELFFHLPFTIAVHLSKAQRFAEAQRWFHYVFDPTSNDPEPDSLIENSVSE